MERFDNWVKNATLKDCVSTKIEIDEFLELFNKKEAILLDIRYPIETRLWSFSFAQKIPYNELPDRLDEIPKDKVVVCACPSDFRSNMAKEYLRYKGFNAKALMGGLNKLVVRFSGGKAKDIKV